MVCETGEGVPNHPRFGTSCGIIVPPIRIITELMSHNGAYYTIFSVGIWSLDERQFIGTMTPQVGWDSNPRTAFAATSLAQDHQRNGKD